MTGRFSKARRTKTSLSEYSKIIAEEFPDYSESDVSFFLRSYMDYIKRFMIKYVGEKHSFAIYLGRHFMLKNTDALRRRKEYYRKYVCKETN